MFGFDFNTKEVKNITNHVAQDIQPMWAGNEIFFLSDRDRTMNIFVYNTQSGATAKVTNSTDYDIKFPSINGNTIVYEQAGYLYRMDVKEKTPVKIPVYIHNDFNYARNETKDASTSIRTSRCAQSANV